MAASEAAPGLAEMPVVTLAPQDADALCPLSIEAGWNQVAADWRLMLSLGQGFGIRDGRGGWLASALAFPLGREVSWLSMVLVTKRARKQGLGTQLLSRCLAAVEASGSVAGLDATDLGRPVYLPLGFHDAFALARWRMERSADPVAPPDGIDIRAIAPHDLAAVQAYDRAASGFARAPILAHLAERWPAAARLAVRADGRIAGFALGRDGYRAQHVGPVVADDEAIALALLSGAAAAGQGAVTIYDVPETHTRIRDWLMDQGATAPRRFMRMLRGTYPLAADTSRVFALAGPELG